MVLVAEESTLDMIRLMLTLLELNQNGCSCPSCNKDTSPNDNTDKSSSDDKSPPPSCTVM